MRLPLAAVLLSCTVAAAARAADEPFTPLFNGRDLSGWVPVQVAPNTFTVRDGMIVCNGVPTGVMRTEKMYENFVLELEYKHLVPGGNAGLFIWSDAITAPGQPFTRSIEVQILDGSNSENHTSHGDVFSIHGATMKPDRPHPRGAMRCLPSERRANPAGQWNHYRVECNDGVLKLAVNGKVVSGGSQCWPRNGYVCLESEGGVVHYRNIRIKELPSTSPKPSDVATADEGFKSIYTGVDLSGWVQDAGHKGHWQPKDWELAYDGKSEAADKHLWTEKEYGDFVLIADWKLVGKPQKTTRPVFLPTGEVAKNANGSEKQAEVMDSGDSGIYLRGTERGQVNIWCWPAGSGELWGVRTDTTAPPEARAAATPKVRADRDPGQWNRFVITAKGDRVTVVLNGQTVVENAHVPGLPPRGRIALQHHGDPIHFANLYVKELK